MGDLSLIRATKLSETDIKEIRKEKKINKKRKLVYNNYKDKISESALMQFGITNLGKELNNGTKYC